MQNLSQSARQDPQEWCAIADILLDVQSIPSTPAAGQAVISVNTTTKKLTVVDDAGVARTLGDLTNASTAQSTGYATDTSLAGSAVQIPTQGLRAGAVYRCKFDMAKTAAGTATATVIVRIGAAGTVSDTARVTHTFTAGTAAVDKGIYEVTVALRSVNASTGTIVSLVTLDHALAATGLTSGGTGGQEQFVAASGSFDTSAATLASLYISVSYNGGASFAGTNELVQAELINT